MRLVGKKARKALLGKSGSGDAMQDADTDVIGDIHQPLLHSHEEYRRRKDNRQKHTVHIKVVCPQVVLRTTSPAIGNASTRSRKRSQLFMHWCCFVSLCMVWHSFSPMLGPIPCRVSLIDIAGCMAVDVY
jgi:hypothetical protein